MVDPVFNIQDAEISGPTEFFLGDRKARAWRCMWCDLREKSEPPENNECPRCETQSLAIFYGPQFDKLEMPNG